jgi:hypothetical protein
MCILVTINVKLSYVILLMTFVIKLLIIKELKNCKLLLNNKQLYFRFISSTFNVLVNSTSDNMIEINDLKVE